MAAHVFSREFKVGAAIFRIHPALTPAGFTTDAEADHHASPLRIEGARKCPPRAAVRAGCRSHAKVKLRTISSDKRRKKTLVALAISIS